MSEIKQDNSCLSYLHIYGQAWFHNEVVIIGNRDGLISLRKAIDEALKTDYPIKSETVFVGDGEGYAVYVRKIEGTDSDWARLEVPYTDECASEKREDFTKVDNLIVEGEAVSGDA